MRFLKKFICFIFAYVPFLRLPIWLVARKFAPESTIAQFGCVVWSAFPKIKSDALQKLSDRVEDLERLFNGRVVPLIGKEIIADQNLWSVLNRFNVPMRLMLLQEILCGSDQIRFKEAIYVLRVLHSSATEGFITPECRVTLRLIRNQFHAKMHPACLELLLKEGEISEESGALSDNAVYVVGK